MATRPKPRRAESAWGLARLVARIVLITVLGTLGALLIWRTYHGPIHFIIHVDDPAPLQRAFALCAVALFASQAQATDPPPARARERWPRPLNVVVVLGAALLPWLLGAPPEAALGHAVVSSLVLAAARLLLRHERGALFAALLFVWHPGQVVWWRATDLLTQQAALALALAALVVATAPRSLAAALPLAAGAIWLHPLAWPLPALVWLWTRGVPEARDPWRRAAWGLPLWLILLLPQAMTPASRVPPVTDELGALFFPLQWGVTRALYLPLSVAFGTRSYIRLLRTALPWREVLLLLAGLAVASSPLWLAGWLHRPQPGTLLVVAVFSLMLARCLTSFRTRYGRWTTAATFLFFTLASLGHNQAASR